MIRILDKLDRHHAGHYGESHNAKFNDIYERMVNGQG